MVKVSALSAPHTDLTLVVFRAGPVWLSAAVDAVEGVIPSPERFSLAPHAAPCVVGFFEHRGETATVVDVACKLGLAGHDGGHLVMVRGEEGLLAFRVDELSEVAPAERFHWAAPPASVPEALFTATLSQPGRLVLHTDFLSLHRFPGRATVDGWVAQLDRLAGRRESSLPMEAPSAGRRQRGGKELPALQVLDTPRVGGQRGGQQRSTQGKASTLSEANGPEVQGEGLSTPDEVQPGEADIRSQPRSPLSSSSPSSSDRGETVKGKTSSAGSAVRGAPRPRVPPRLVEKVGCRLPPRSEEGDSDTPLPPEPSVLRPPTPSRKPCRGVGASPRRITPRPPRVVPRRQHLSSPARGPAWGPPLTALLLTLVVAVNFLILTEGAAVGQSPRTSAMVASTGGEAKGGRREGGNQEREETRGKVAIPLLWPSVMAGGLSAAPYLPWSHALPSPAAPPFDPRRLQVHVVDRGDTLWHLAEQLLDDPWRYRELALFSNIRDPDLILPGEFIYFFPSQGTQGR